MPYTLHQVSPCLGEPHPLDRTKKADSGKANALYWSLFGDETGWGVPDDCLPTRKGYPWKRIVKTYGLPTIRAIFKQGNFQGCEVSYAAEVKFAAWCKRNGYYWTFISTDH